MNDKSITKANSHEAFELAQREAKAYSSGDLVPAQYRGNVANTLIAMEVAKRIGASTLSVMQSLYIVHGKPAWSSSFLIATVNASGRFSPLRFRFVNDDPPTIKNLNWGCRAYAVDKESGEECVGPLVTIAMADAEGWLSKKNKKDVEISKWQTMPELMLTYRAAAFWTRIYAPELSLGIHTQEEVRDIQTVEAEVVRSSGNDLDSLMEDLKKQVETKKNIEPVPPLEPEKKLAPVVLKDGELSPMDELVEVAKEKWGKDAQKELNALAKSLKYDFAQLTDEQACAMIDNIVKQNGDG